MTWFERDRLLAWLLCATLVALAGEGWWLWRIRGAAIGTVAVLGEKNRERDGLRLQSPTATEENELAIDRDLIVARTKLAEMEKALIGVAESGAGNSTVKSTDAYFEIAGFVEKMRTLAGQSTVATRPDERFGFASYASEGPAPDILPSVVRQRAAIQILLETLLTAQPVTLISVQRERPPAMTSHATAGDPTDFFEIAPAWSLRKPGMLETDAFKLEFTGQTQVLREFSNRLMSVSPAFAVRSVEAEPLVSAVKNTDTGGRTMALLPIVPAGLSRFRVVIEQLRPVPGIGKTTP